MSDCFRRWRDINSIEKLRERMSNQQKESLLKVLNGLLTTGKTAQIREAINKFRLNRRITEIQRNFLKRLLMSKAGLVVIAFRKIQTLPERKDNAAFLSLTIRKRTCHLRWKNTQESFGSLQKWIRIRSSCQEESCHPIDRHYYGRTKEDVQQMEINHWKDQIDERMQTNYLNVPNS